MFFVLVPNKDSYQANNFACVIFSEPIPYGIFPIPYLSLDSPIEQSNVSDYFSKFS